MLQVDHRKSQPVYQQIYEQIKHDIITGKLTVGTRITSTRVLAKELQVGRNTVENAYDQLVLEGYIASVPSSGYVVNNMQFYLNQKSEKLLDYKAAVLAPNRKVEDVRYNFQYGNLDATIFPHKLWRKYLTDILESREAQEVHSYGDVKGDIKLRIQLREYLYHSRGVNCQPEQIVICSGTQSALEIMISEYSVEITDRFYQGRSWYNNQEFLVPYRLLFMDELTKIYNRRYITEILPSVLDANIQKRSPMSVIFTDIDNFKQINDQYGHIAGDRILCAFAYELQLHIDKNHDWVARYGGDEFLICLQNADEYRARHIAEEIRQAIMKQEFLYENHKIMLTCSLGIYTVEDFTKSFTCDMLLTIIDEKLY